MKLNVCIYQQLIKVNESYFIINYLSMPIKYSRKAYL